MAPLNTPAKDNSPNYSENFTLFKTGFHKRLAAAAPYRESHAAVPKHLRRLDGLARLFETSHTCVAVYYDTVQKNILIATNDIIATSRENSGKIQHLKEIIELISNADLPMDQIIQKFASSIFINVKHEEWRVINTLQISDAALEMHIKNLLNQLFKSGNQTKIWRDEAIAELDDNKSETKFYKSLIHKVARLTRDLIKTKESLLFAAQQNRDEQAILQALRNKQVKILHLEGNKVHAEMRILANILNNKQPPNYIGISKLCCNHCSLAMNAFAIPTRGKHGQGFNWAVPRCISINPDHLKKFLGDELYAQYQPLKAEEQKEALKYIASKKSSPYTGHTANRSMEHDSSDSDCEFGLDCSNNTANQVKTLPYQKIWQLRYTKNTYTEEFERLEDFGMTDITIYEFYKKSPEKFQALTSEEVYMFILNLSNKPADKFKLFNQLSELYEKNSKLFHILIDDEGNMVEKDSFDDILDHYRTVLNKSAYSSEEEIYSEFSGSEQTYPSYSDTEACPPDEEEDAINYPQTDLLEEIQEGLEKLRFTKS